MPRMSFDQRYKGAGLPRRRTSLREQVGFPGTGPVLPPGMDLGGGPPSLINPMIKGVGTAGSTFLGGSTPPNMLNLPRPQPPLRARLAGEYQSAFNEAKDANEGRYREILTELGRLGDAERTDINQAYTNLENRNMQDMVSRGIAGTTVAGTMRQGVARERNRSLGALEERLRGQKLGFMERREDEYPDMNQMLQLLQGLGRYGTGSDASSPYNFIPMAAGRHSTRQEIYARRAARRRGGAQLQASPFALPWRRY